MSAIKAFSRAGLKVQAKASATTKIKTAAKVAAPAPKAATKSNNLTVLVKIAELGLLSKAEDLKLLSKLQESGLLGKAEEAGLLSFAEKSGVINLVADPSTPGTLSSAGVLLVAVAAAVAYHAGDNTVVDVVAALVALLGLTSLAGGSILDKVQRL